jgi:predicted RNA-binding protein
MEEAAAMCQSNVYAIEGGTERLLMEEVTAVVVDGDNVELTTLFGESLVLRARIKEVDLVKNRIVLERIPDKQA